MRENQNPIREFFLRRVGVPMDVPANLCPAGHSYKIIIKTITPRKIIATVMRYQTARLGNQAPDKSLEVEIDIGGYTNPATVFADCVKLLEGRAPEGETRPENILSAEKVKAAKEVIRSLIVDRTSTNPPTSQACSQFIQIITNNPRLIIPELSVITNGQIRAKWRDNKKTVWLKLNGESPLSWVFISQSEGQRGEKKLLRALTETAEEFIYFCSLLGLGLLDEEIN